MAEVRKRPSKCAITARDYVKDSIAYYAEMAANKSYVQLSHPIIRYVQKLAISDKAKMLFLLELFPLGQQSGDYFASITQFEIEYRLNLKKTRASAALHELIDVGLAEPAYETAKNGHKAIIGVQLIIPYEAAKQILEGTPDRKGKGRNRMLSEDDQKKAADQLINELEVPLSVGEKTVNKLPIQSEKRPNIGPEKWSIKRNRGCYTKTTNNNPGKVNQEKAYSLLAGCDPEEILNVVFSLKEQNNIRNKLESLGHRGTSNDNLLYEISYSLTAGQWKISKPKAVDVILRMIAENTWRSPYYSANTQPRSPECKRPRVIQQVDELRGILAVSGR